LARECAVKGCRTSAGETPARQQDRSTAGFVLGGTCDKVLTVLAN
jgi:hypothetical protein